VLTGKGALDQHCKHWPKPPHRYAAPKNKCRLQPTCAGATECWRWRWWLRWRSLRRLVCFSRKRMRNGKTQSTRRRRLFLGFDLLYLPAFPGTQVDWPKAISELHFQKDVRAPWVVTHPLDFCDFGDMVVFVFFNQYPQDFHQRCPRMGFIFANFVN
jgi:hypothetical protein